jgi:cysteinyl-tRNA synthetase, unknown class
MRGMLLPNDTERSGCSLPYSQRTPTVTARLVTTTAAASWVRVLTALALLLAVSATSPATAQTSVGPGPFFSKAKSWGYQLNGLDVEVLAKAPYDVIVVDYSRDGGPGGALTAADVERLRRKPDGSRRIVLCYLSIGEAEDYRYYWKWHWGILWGLFAPSWRGAHNAEWAGNYAVRYWQPGWQSIILGSSESARDGYLDRIVAAGFDGVYLDKIDSSLERVGTENSNARTDMVAFVKKIAEKSRSAKPGFLIVPQNGEELLTIPGYRALIDGLGKEDLLFGEETSGKPNPPAIIAKRSALLAMLIADRKPVLAVEYLDDPATIETTRKKLLDLGLIPHFADRELDSMRFGDLPTGRSSKKPRW